MLELCLGKLSKRKLIKMIIKLTVNLKPEVKVCMGDSVNTLSTWFLSGPCSPGQNCGWSPRRSLGVAAAEAPWDTGARRSWAEPSCGIVEAGCCSSRCGSRYPGHLRHCPGHPELQQETGRDELINLS